MSLDPDVRPDGGRVAGEPSGADAAHKPTWFTRLGRVLSDLGDIADVEGVTEVAVERAADAVGASTASLWRVDPSGDTLTLLGVRGLEPGVVMTTTVSRAARIPPCDALRQSSALILTGRAEVALRYPDLEPAMRGDDVSILCLVLRAGTRDIGVLGLRFARLWRPDNDQLEFLQLFASSCAQALERVQALERADHSAANLAFLAQASQELAGSLDYRTTLARVARLAVPTLGDWCAVEILEDGVLHSLAVEHVDPARVALARELQERYPTDPHSTSGAPNVARTGISELYPEIPDEMLVAATRDEEHLRLARALGLRSGLTVPLIARGRVLGVISLVVAESGRRYGPDDVRLAEDLARRAAVAIDNSQLFSQTRDIAVELQHAVLPSPFPDHPHWQVATHYSPAGRTEVGGDFYDAVLVDDGRLLAVIGDVAGRGVEAAAAMAQMRAAIRAHAAVDPDPASILAKLDLMFDKFHIHRLVTVAIALIEAQAETIVIANAGHLPPVLVAADGGVTVAHAPTVERLLGVGPVTRSGTTYPFAAGSTVLLYTDGLIERRDESISDGVARLVRSAGRQLWETPAAALRQVVSDTQDTARDDDVTAIALTGVRPQQLVAPAASS